MNILYCGDENMCDGILLSALSLSNHAREALSVFIISAKAEYDGKHYAPIPAEYAIVLEYALKSKNPENRVFLFDISEMLREESPSANLSTHFTPFCMLRLFADKIKEIPDKILYLDADVLCRRNPADFYYTDMSGYELAGVPDYYGGWLFHNENKVRDYINSGVLLLNMKLIRKTRLFARCRRMCSEKKMFMPDQSAINKLSHAKKLCKRKYNEQRKKQTDTVFRHFTTSFRFFPRFKKISVKPWDKDGMHNILHEYEFDTLLEEYKEIKEKSNNYTEIY